jgi:hypothetical protein
VLRGRLGQRAFSYLLERSDPPEPTVAKQARHHVCCHDEILIEVEE